MLKLYKYRYKYSAGGFVLGREGLIVFVLCHEMELRLVLLFGGSASRKTRF